jgi:hypothetical protein
MQCEEAQQLFDGYLDGELSPSLATELAAHRVQCSECRRALALLEVSEHIISSDRNTVTLEAGFAERLIACMEHPPVRWTDRVGRWLYVGAPLAAAAVIALAFLGVFDGRRTTEVAGDRVVANLDDILMVTSPETSEASPGGLAPGDENLIGRVQTSLEQKRRSAESLRSAIDLTLLQQLHLLEQANQTKPAEGTPAGGAASGVEKPAKPGRKSTDADEVEEL